MKITSISVVGSLAAIASSTYTQKTTQTLDFVCSDYAPSTVYQTVTVTAAPEVPYYPQDYRKDPYVTTHGGSVTSVDYDGSKSTIYVYPTGSPNHDCVKAVYENDVIISVNIININVIINNGYASTTTLTLASEPSYTPKPPVDTYTTSYAPSYTSSYPSYPTGKQVYHTVQVGPNGKFVYEPSYINAAIGDIVKFEFNPRNHTLTESNFNTPCSPNGRFDTGFNQFVAPDAAHIIREFKVEVNTPQWFYCAQTAGGSHCNKGMVFAINPRDKFDEFLAKATAGSGNGDKGTATYSSDYPTYTSSHNSYSSAYPTNTAISYVKPDQYEDKSTYSSAYPTSTAISYVKPDQYEDKSTYSSAYPTRTATPYAKPDQYQGVRGRRAAAYKA